MDPKVGYLNICQHVHIHNTLKQEVLQALLFDFFFNYFIRIVADPGGRAV
jgi:hypothetical protein